MLMSGGLRIAFKMGTGKVKIKNIGLEVVILDSKGQIFDACHISVTRISAPKRLAVVVNTKKMFNTKMKQLFGAETCVAEI
jgi:hypothetical protein